jgi:hypothetical protein
MIQALLVTRALDAVKAEQVARVIKKLGRSASFRNVWKEVARAGILKHNMTLRTYLDLLVRSGVLSVEKQDVGSVYAKEIYLATSARPRVCTGLSILQKHGLNWDAPETEIRITPTDFSGLVRSKPFDQRLMACLEDCLVNEAYLDAKKQTGTFSLVAAMIATRKLDLPYLLRRADEMRMGTTFRTLFARILEVTSANVTSLDASLFLAVRQRFLQITRQYVRSGFWKLVDSEKGVGLVGLRVVRGLSDDDIVLAAAKQLGVTG